MEKREYKCSENTKEALFRSLLKLSKEKGFDKVTIRDICTDAEVSIGSFYHHFKSKDELAKETYFQTDKLINEDFIKVCESSNPKENLYNILRIYVEYVSREVGSLVKAYYKLVLDMTDVSAFEPERLYYKSLKNIIQKCAEEGYIKKFDSYDEVTAYCSRFIRGLIFDWCVNEGKYNLEEKFESDFKFFMSGLEA